MITVKIETKGIADLLRQKIELIRDKEKLMRYLAVSMIPEIKVRVHQDGLDANGQRIGTYSPAYMKVRTGVFSRNAKFTKGKNKGKNKPTGVFTSGPREGQQRPRYNRTSDTKVILSLTRQMENDMTAIPTASGYGIGYLNAFNAQKARWNEATYKKTIWELTKEEREKLRLLTNQYLNNNAKA